VVQRYQQRHNNWIFVQHEDRARAPVASFRRLYDELVLYLSAEIRPAVERHSDSQNPVETEAVGTIHKDSQALIYNWKNRLTETEITQGCHRTEPIASHFYAADDW
jgi:hypothetical protein